MPANDYVFVTRWRVEATPEEVYTILDDALSLPRWWPSVYLAVTKYPPDPGRGPGNVYDLLTKGWLPYKLRWKFRRTDKNPPHGFKLEAWGDFVGEGVWQFTADGPVTNVQFDWRIRTDKPLLRYLSFVMKPIFAANHRWAMKQGEISLKLELERRRAKTADERARVSPPPGPTFWRRTSDLVNREANSRR